MFSAECLNGISEDSARHGIPEVFVSIAHTVRAESCPFGVILRNKALSVPAQGSGISVGNYAVRTCSREPPKPLLLHMEHLPSVSGLWRVSGACLQRICRQRTP